MTDSEQSDSVTLRRQLSIAEDALREIASPGCMIARDDEGVRFIDTRLPGIVAEGALKRIREHGDKCS